MKTNWKHLLGIGMMVFAGIVGFTSCGSDDDDDFMKPSTGVEVKFRPSFFSVGIEITPQSKIVLDKLQEIGLLKYTTGLTGSNYVYVSNLYQQFGVALKDTAAVLESLKQQAKQDYAAAYAKYKEIDRSEERRVGKEC